MRTKSEIRKRLEEAASARKQLIDEQAAAADQNNDELVTELATEIANLSGTVGTLEWVLQVGVGFENVGEDETAAP